MCIVYVFDLAGVRFEPFVLLLFNALQFAI